MPFDAIGEVARLNPLAEALERRGITPVSWELLSAHKDAELEKAAPNFWFRYPEWLLIASLISIVGMAAASGLAPGLTRGSPSLPFYLSFGWMCLIFLFVATGFFGMRGGSHWEERRVPACRLDGVGVPEPIATVARQLHRDAPSSSLILGELVRDSVVLDPYLLLVCGPERVCLGIWDGRRIIASAETPPAA